MGTLGFEVVSCLLKAMSFNSNGLLFSKFVCMLGGVYASAFCPSWHVGVLQTWSSSGHLGVYKVVL